MPESNECLSRDDVAAQVAAGQLWWKSGPPALGSQVVTRSWFATYVVNNGSVPQDNRLMTWGEMLTYRVEGPAGAPTITFLRDASVCDVPKGISHYYAEVLWTNADPDAVTVFEYQKPVGTGPWTYADQALPGQTSKILKLPGEGSYLVRAYHVKNNLQSGYSNAEIVNIIDPCGQY